MTNNWNTPSCSGFLVTSLSDVTDVLKDTETDLIQSLDMLQEELEAWNVFLQHSDNAADDMFAAARINKLTAQLKSYRK